MDNGVFLQTIFLVCWLTLVLLGAFAILFFPHRKSAFSSCGGEETGALSQHGNRMGVAKLLLLALLLFGVVFLIPDVGQSQHKSFFSVAQDSPWTQPFDWPAVWCSAKIIVLSVSLLLVLEAVLSLMVRTDHPTACVALLVLAVVPTFLGFFGLYELVKAVL